MSNYIEHSHNLEQRLHEAQSLLIAISSEEVIQDLRVDRLMASLSGIEQLIEVANREHDKMLSAVQLSEVLG